MNQQEDKTEQQQKQPRATSASITFNEATDTDSSSRASSSCYQESDSGDCNICMSPPNNSRMNKKGPKSRKRRSHSRRDHNKHRKSLSNTKNSDKQQQQQQRPVLLNSAENIQNATSNEHLIDSIMQEQQNVNSKSAPNTASADQFRFQSPWPNLISQTNSFHDSSEIHSSSSFKQPTTKKFDKKTSHYHHHHHYHHLDEIDPHEREESIKRITLLLKLALSTSTLKEVRPHSFQIPVPPPPSTPSTSLTQTNSFSSAFSRAATYSSQQSQNVSSSKYSSSYATTTSSASSLNIQESASLIRQQEKNQQAEQVWKEIYDYFEFYNGRATSDNADLVERRLSDARSQIPVIIKEIMSTNFHQITHKMTHDIRERMRSPLSYLNLYEQKIYIDQLCYLYWLVEDVINRVSYIETLYPSLQSMKRNEPAYADTQFEAVNKTLILWYKIMTELMTKSDTLGRFLGFAKRDENKQYWSWFDECLSFSRQEYDNVHKWLKQTFQPSARSTNGVPRSQSRSQVSSPVIDLNKPMFPISPNPSPQISQQQTRALKQSRQISYELHACKKLLPTPSLLSEFSMASERNESRRGSNIHLASGLKSDKKLSQNLLPPDLLFSDLLSKTDKDHLEPAKIHHVTSFLSQNSLLSETESAKIYLNLQSKSLSNSRDAESAVSHEASPSPLVGFNLNDTALEMEALKLEVDDYDQSPASSASDTATDTKPIIIETNDNSTQMRQKILKEFLHKRLRKHGLTKTFDEIRKKVMNALPHALQTLQIDYCEYYNPMSSTNDPCNHHLIPLHKRYLEFMDMFPFDEETLVYGVRSQSFQKLNLPSFRPIFLYLNNIILELMHVCIKMQIEGKRDMKQQANFKFSLLSIEVLTHELRECIEQAILVRQFYYNMVYSVFEKSELDVQQQLENDLVPFDDDLKLIISIYLSFVTDWVHDLVACSDTLKAIGVLQDEWYFCKNNLYFVTASEDIYAKRFCALCKMVIGSLVDSLHDLDTRHKQPLMEYIVNLELKQELNASDLVDDESQQNSMPLEQEAKQEEENQLENEEEKEEDVDEDEDDEDNESKLNENDQEDEDDQEINLEDECDDCEDLNYDMNTKRHNRYIDLVPGAYDINLKCNEFKEEVNQLRKRCMKALGFCSNLIDDLSLAAKFTILKNKMQFTLDQLKQSHHVLVQFTNPELQSSQPIVKKTRDTQLASDGAPFMIFVPQEFSKDKIQIARLLFLISAKDDYETKESETEAAFKADPLNASFDNSSSTLKNEKFFKSSRAKSFRRMSSSNSFMECNEDSQRSMLNKLSKFANLSTPTVTASRMASPQPNTYILSPQVNGDGYLLYLKIPNKIDETWEWTGNVIRLFAALPVRRALYQHKSSSDTSEDSNTNKQVNLILVVPRPKLLEKIIKLEVRTRFRSAISLVKEKTSFHPNIEYAIDEVKESILNLRSESAKSIRSIEKDLKTHYDTPIWIKQKSSITYQRYLSEIWRVSYNFGIDLQNECIKFKTHDQEEQFIQGLADFCIMWCEYIQDKTERGKGKTVQPWAARKGIQLLQEAFHLSTSLTDTEYVKLRNSVEKCLSHVIGERSNSSSSSQASYKHSESNTNSATETLTRNMNSTKPPGARFSQACMAADNKREQSLQDKRYIGKILNAQREQNIITATEVNFRWQLGLKIGEGQYGTVYSCVNLDTGEPMAMKEIPFKSNDVEAIKNIYSEINNLQGIRHDNLVRLYGSELHRKEMLIFMEFCGDQCTLDRISKETSGLPEKIVRGYTKSLLEAVATLHENNIMHRDIKGSNIFLKAIDPKHPEKIVLKLGDFGCSIKFKDIIGSSPAKATGFMGTFPFMAPEVMTSGGAVNAGYTISADIWSLGCVVIEMFTGKRPWHPLSDENILYKVHIQKPPVLKPPYPTQNIISEEAIHFLDACLEFEPSRRLTADQLLNHPFVKVHEPTNETTSNDYFSL